MKELTYSELKQLKPGSYILIDTRDSGSVLYGMIARIEIMPEEFPKIIQEDIRSQITESFKNFGFTYVSLDLTGYRTGSMNETF